jgi:archaellum component FlaC
MKRGLEMTYEELIVELCDVIKESESNSIAIYENLETIDSSLEKCENNYAETKKIRELISNSFGLLQHQDLHRQKIERVVNYVCEHNNIDSSEYNISASAKHIAGDNTSDVVSDAELEELIKSMQS